MYPHFFKRFVDITLSAIGLVVISPLFLIVTILQWLANSGKPFFTQTRPGKNARLFKVIISKP